MGASRFPGKPLASIAGRPMLEHVYRRANLYPNWDQLVIATCDREIFDFAVEKEFKVVETGSHHNRALDRVAEAVEKTLPSMSEQDVVVCVQGDEPLLLPDMIEAVVEPLRNDDKINATVLGIHVTEEEVWLNPDTVKIASNKKGEILYTSRAPIPYAKEGFSSELKARRVAGIFAFRPDQLRAFADFPETRLEILEACDSNRILDMEFSQFLAPFDSVPLYSVDSPSDIALVERAFESDPLLPLY